MKHSPLVSIIIPTYNRAYLISETLESVLAQSYQNWECIVVDDGSEDDTDNVMKAYLERDNRIKYYHRPETHLSGGNGARNYGFSKSTGDYVNWFDSDDIMFTDFIKARMRAFEKYPKADVVFSAFENINRYGKRTRIANQSFSGNILNDLVDGKVSFGPLSYLLRKKSVKHLSYNETLKKNQDLDFFFRLFTGQNALYIEHVPKILFKVRSHKGSTWHGAGRDIVKMNSIYSVYVMVLDYFVKHGHTTGIANYKRKSLGSLKTMLKNGFYKEVLNKLIHFKYLSLTERVYLMGCTILYYFTKKGASQFVKLEMNVKN